MVGIIVFGILSALAAGQVIGAYFFETRADEEGGDGRR